MTAMGSIWFYDVLCVVKCVLKLGADADLEACVDAREAEVLIGHLEMVSCKLMAAAKLT